MVFSRNFIAIFFVYISCFTIKHNAEQKQSSEVCNFIKKRLYQRCFLVNFAKYLTRTFLQNTSVELLLIEAMSDLFFHILHRKKIYYPSRLFVIKAYCFLKNNVSLDTISLNEIAYFSLYKTFYSTVETDYF